MLAIKVNSLVRGLKGLKFCVERPWKLKKRFKIQEPKQTKKKQIIKVKVQFLCE